MITSHSANPSSIIVRAVSMLFHHSLWRLRQFVVCTVWQWHRLKAQCWFILHYNTIQHTTSDESGQLQRVDKRTAITETLTVSLYACWYRNDSRWRLNVSGDEIVLMCSGKEFQAPTNELHTRFNRLSNDTFVCLFLLYVFCFVLLFIHSFKFLYSNT